jgi:hypothetical protein
MTLEMGLGSLNAVSLAKARKKAAEARGQLSEGTDPKASRDAARAAERRRAPGGKSFSSCDEAYIEAHRAGWKNEKRDGELLSREQSTNDRRTGGAFPPPTA